MDTNTDHMKITPIKSYLCNNNDDNDDNDL